MPLTAVTLALAGLTMLVHRRRRPACSCCSERRGTYPVSGQPDAIRVCGRCFRDALAGES